jgi:hypothetical protein
VEYEEVGNQLDYESIRQGEAKVFLNDQNIGSVSFVLVNRHYVGHGGLSFWMACDAVSGGGVLESVAASFFHRDNGSIKPEYRSKLKCKDQHAVSNEGCFMYISDIELKTPYDRHCPEENVHIATTAIRKLVTSSALTDAVQVTLVMYIPDSPNDFLDERPFIQAGFTSVMDKSRRFKYLVYEVGILE